jgi:putative membrane protein
MHEPPPINPEDVRLRLAGEQNLLAWVRTGLALMGFGFVVARFGLFLHQIAIVEHTRIPPSSGMSLLVGMTLILAGVAVNALAAFEHHFFLRRIDRHEPYQPPRIALSIVVSLFLSALGLGMIALLASQPI